MSTELNDGVCRLTEVSHNEGSDSQVLRDRLYSDFLLDSVATYGQTDFRPWVRRGVEVYLDVPQTEWHNPTQYATESLDKVVDDTVALLFRGQERATMLERVKDSKLRIANGLLCHA